ncbi:hypothetical protein FDO65_15965 [Nakamurella flava]|uniref:Uncharacterized protein n=1 Tax=Nakamurella flava TaxID=2576308 RepID=A0A4U6QCK5_9ACTN|nr:hypothetical protein [Nakamurella flava]TKV57649.1 hypothetical protein FDO65_15965 [Nakamurella flava]
MRFPRVALIGVVLATAACSAAADADSADPTPPAVRTLLDGLSATADSVADQQAALAAAVDPVGGLSGCAAATSTIRFEPVWAAVHPVPQWRPSSGAPPAGEVYEVPSVLRIVRDGRIAGTDLATLHVGVQDGVARLVPFCIQ